MLEATIVFTTGALWHRHLRRALDEGPRAGGEGSKTITGKTIVKRSIVRRVTRGEEVGYCRQ